MPIKQVHTDRRDMGHMVEHQMRNWELSRETVSPLPDEPRAQPVLDFVAISRDPGLSGRDLAEPLAKHLGWPVFDKEILQVMAGDAEYRKQLYEKLDERDVNWMESIFESMSSRELPRDDYFRRLCRTVLAISRQGHAVFLGRGAELILPIQVGFRVFLTASRAYRQKLFAATQNITELAAGRKLRELERDRAKFMRVHFETEPGDPLRFDLVINAEKLSAPQAMEIILVGMRQRGMIEH